MGCGPAENAALGAAGSANAEADADAPVLEASDPQRQAGVSKTSGASKRASLGI
jgi:hypothetical protein